MMLVKLLLVALALWMPAASMAAPVEAESRVETSAQSAEHEAHGSESEESELFFALPAAPHVFEHLIGFCSHRPLDGHIIELLIPPPNPS
jgi:hypothetical protein